MAVALAMAFRRRSICLLVAVLAVAGCGASPLDAVTINPHSLATGLVAHWTFDEGSGTTAADSSGAAHPLTLQGGRSTPRTLGVTHSAR